MQEILALQITVSFVIASAFWMPCTENKLRKKKKFHEACTKNLNLQKSGHCDVINDIVRWKRLSYINRLAEVPAEVRGQSAYVAIKFGHSPSNNFNDYRSVWSEYMELGFFFNQQDVTCLQENMDCAEARGRSAMLHATDWQHSKGVLSPHWNSMKIPENVDLCI